MKCVRTVDKLLNLHQLPEVMVLCRKKEMLAPAVKKKRVYQRKARGTRRPKEVRARIMEAAIASFARHGFEGARMRSIAVDAAISIQLLVHHFKSKDKVWRTTMERIIDQYNHSMSASRESGAGAWSSAADRLKQAITDLVRFMGSTPDLQRMVTAEAAHATPRMLWLAERFFKHGFLTWCSLIESAQREGAVRPVDPARLRFAIVAMASVPFGVAAEYEYFTGCNPFTPNEVARTIDIICDMVFI